MNMLPSQNIQKTGHFRPFFKGHPQAPKRRGTSTVELAIALPVLLTLIFGSLDVCEAIHTKHSLKLAAYQGVRMAIAPDATNESVMEAVEGVLKFRNVKDYEVETIPSDISRAERGQEVSINVGIRKDKQGRLDRIIHGKNGMLISTVMVKE